MDASQVLRRELAPEITSGQVLQEKSNQFFCFHRIQSLRSAIKNFDCAQQRAGETLAKQNDAWDLYQALETIQKRQAHTDRLTMVLAR